MMKTPSLLSTLLATLLTCEVLAPVGGNQCYVCHSDIPEDNRQLRKTFPGDKSFPACSSFTLSSDLSRFMRTCPESGSCLTKTSQEGGVMRTCSRVRVVDDCKVANGVTYCYCNTDNCNGLEEDKEVKEHSGAGPVETRYLPAAAPYVVKYPDNTHVDDEDSVEEGGSGDFYYNESEYNYGDESYNYYGDTADYGEYSGGGGEAPEDRKREKSNERDDIVLEEEGGTRWRQGSSGASRGEVLWVLMVPVLHLLRRSVP